MFRTLFFCILIAWPATGWAQSNRDAFFDNYDDLRATLDPLVKGRQIQDLMLAFGGADEMTASQLQGLEAQVLAIYPEDLVSVQRIKRVEMDNGWRSELLAFWSGERYLYIYLLMHERDGELLSVNMRFNSDFHSLYKLL